jgi:hypothetical protein
MEVPIISSTELVADPHFCHEDKKICNTTCMIDRRVTRKYEYRVCTILVTIEVAVTNGNVRALCEY